MRVIMLRMFRMGLNRGRRSLQVGVIAILLTGVVGAPVVSGPAFADDATPAPTPAATDPAATPAPADPAATPAPTDPAATPAPAPSKFTPPPLVMPTQLGSWCTALFPPEGTNAEREDAQDLMGGKVTMYQGGVYHLAADPDWKPQSGTDTSGDRHVNSLFWALPLLYRGVHKQVPGMVERFRTLMYDWLKDHQGQRSYWTNGSIYGGLRTQTLVCAAQTLNEPVLLDAAMDDAKRMISGYKVPPVIAVGANNTDVIRQTGAFAAYCLTGDIPNRERAWANLVGVANGVVEPDGSDVEGSPGYAEYIEKLLSGVERAATTCGLMSDNINALQSSVYNFVAQATRPDFKITSLGDTINDNVKGHFGVGIPAADWVRTGGASGTPPLDVYQRFAGGYVFGRAGWTPQPGMPDTYYSLRFTSDRPRTPHTHDDGAGLTLYSRGVEWIGDPGPYRYDNGSSLRYYMLSRTAHSSMTVSGVGRNLRAGVRSTVTASDWQQGGNDTTCLKDKTWGSVDVTRCVVYVRSVDAVIVVDHARASKIKGKKARKRAAPRVVTERWQLPPGIGAQGGEGVLTLTGGDKRMDVYTSGPGGWDVHAAKGGSWAGWFTGEWGKKVPGAVLSRAIPLSVRGDDQTAVTVFVPRVDGESVPVTIDANGVTITRNGLTITTPLPAS